MRVLALLLGSMFLAAAEPLPVVPQVDLARYMGTWHEVARLPNRFQRGCGCTSATYTLREDGRVSVLNQCRTPGKNKAVRGWAKVVDRSTNAKLKVTFFWPFFGDYWVLALDPDYRWVLVGTPNRKYLWVLSRTPRLEEATLQGLLERAQTLGFDTSRILRTEPCDPPLSPR